MYILQSIMISDQGTRIKINIKTKKLTFLKKLFTMYQ